MNTSEVKLTDITPLFSVRRLAEYFDCYKEDGTPSNDTILSWVRSGLLPAPDLRLSRKAIYWLPKTIHNYIQLGSLNGR